MFSQVFDDRKGVGEGQECAKRMTKELGKTFEEERDLIISDIWFTSLWQESIASNKCQLERHDAVATHVGIRRKLSGSDDHYDICCSYTFKLCSL